jgi:hypothetical protein
MSLIVLDCPKAGVTGTLARWPSSWYRRRRHSPTQHFDPLQVVLGPPRDSLDVFQGDELRRFEAISDECVRHRTSWWTGPTTGFLVGRYPFSRSSSFK